MSRPLRYRRFLNRTHEFARSAASRALRRCEVDFTLDRPMVSIIGDHISDRIRIDGLYEREFLEFLRDRIIDPAEASSRTALDVGANIGNHSLFLSDIFQRVIAFEPNPLTRSLLQLNISMNNVTNVEVRAVGLSDRAARVTLEYDHHNLGAATMSPGASNASHKLIVEVEPGDEVIDRSEPIGFIKVDVEGGEESALRGLERTIHSHQPVIMIEQWAHVIDESQGTSPCFNFLRNLGYSAWELTASPPRGKLGKLISLILGHADYRLVPIERLEKRNYSVLCFTPVSYVFPEQLPRVASQ